MALYDLSAEHAQSLRALKRKRQIANLFEDGTRSGARIIIYMLLMHTVFDPVCLTRRDAREYAVFGKLLFTFPFHPPFLTKAAFLHVLYTVPTHYQTSITPNIQLSSTFDTPFFHNVINLTRLFVPISLTFQS